MSSTLFADKEIDGKIAAYREASAEKIRNTVI